MPDLREVELEALRVLWEQGRPLKPSEIQGQFPREIDNGTLRSTLSCLMEKGLVTRHKKGKAFLYQPKTDHNTLLKTLAARLARIFSQGSTAGLIARLIEAEDLTPEEVGELRRLTRTKAKTSRKGGSRK
jgi:predicted transcriptional regulator